MYICIDKRSYEKCKAGLEESGFVVVWEGNDNVCIKREEVLSNALF